MTRRTADPASKRVPRPLLLIVLAFCALALTGCDGTGDPPTRTDAPPGTPIAIEAAPLVSVGVARGDSLQEFGRVVTPFVLPDRRLAVPDGIALAIRTFDFDGEHLASYGGPGEGPGEFSFLAGAWASGDTIEAFDFQTVRVTRFLPDESVEVVSLRSIRFGSSVIPGALPDGWVISGLLNSGQGSERPARSRDQVGLVKLALDGTTQSDLTETLGVARYTDAAGNLQVEPLSPRGLYVVRNGKLYVGETLTPTIRRYDSDGTLEAELTWPATPPMSPAEAFQLVVDSAVARASPEDVPSVRRTLEAAPVPDALSVFWDFMVDDEGFIWVRPYEPALHAHYLGGWSGPRAGGSWMILSPEGDRVGTVDVPDDLEPVEAGTDVLLAIARDELGVASVRLHAIDRR